MSRKKMKRRNRLEFLDEVFNEDEQRLADWKDANALCDEKGAPKELSLEAKIRWLLSEKENSAA